MDVVIEHHFELLKQFLGISFLSRECSSPASLWESQIYPGSRGLPLVVRSKGLCGNNTVWLSNSNMAQLTCTQQCIWCWRTPPSPTINKAILDAHNSVFGAGGHHVPPHLTRPGSVCAL